MKNRLDLTLEMPKSRATIQKDYRASQKEKKGDEYMEKERERKRKAYVPVSQLEGNDLKMIFLYFNSILSLLSIFA